MVSGMLRRARVRDWISVDEGWWGGGEVEVCGCLGVGEAVFSVFVLGPFEGEGEAEVREVEVMMVVAWRFAGLVVERETFSRRDLNLVRLSCRAAVASSWGALSRSSFRGFGWIYFIRENHKSHALALSSNICRDSYFLHSAVL